MDYVQAVGINPSNADQEVFTPEPDFSQAAPDVRDDAELNPVAHRDAVLFKLQVVERYFPTLIHDTFRLEGEEGKTGLPLKANTRFGIRGMTIDVKRVFSDYKNVTFVAAGPPPCYVFE